MLELVVLLSDDMNGRLARDQLTTSRAAVLWHLRHSGPVTQRTLADSLKITPRTVTGLIDGLVATGFVTRNPHPTDRRATLVTPTSRADNTLRTLEAEQETFTSLLFDTMPPETYQGFAEGLGHVVTQIRAAL
jgi:DNA-binding MarR family transcriptional regulator